MAERIRPAKRSDYGAFVRLFPELAVPDAIMGDDKFAGELVPTTLVMETSPDQVAGYVYFQIMKDTAYVRHIVTAPEARRRGVGRALLGAVAERAREANIAK